MSEAIFVYSYTKRRYDPDAEIDVRSPLLIPKKQFVIAKMGVICSYPVHLHQKKNCMSKNSLTLSSIFAAIVASDTNQLHRLIGPENYADLKDKSGRTALHLACSEGNKTFVKFLLEKHADVNAQDKQGNSPIKEAIMSGHSQIVSQLLEAGASVSRDLRAELEWTLRHAAFHGAFERVRCLVECGVSTSAADWCGKTALDLAQERGHARIAKYLSDKTLDQQNESNLLDPKDTAAETPTIKLLETAAIKACTGEESGNHRRRMQNASFSVLDAFPRPIAAALLQGRPPQPLDRPAASLLYADMCGFTALCAGVDAALVAGLARRLFEKLDRLAHLHGVQQVHIAGDAYVAATNLTEDQPHDHAARLARFAADALAAARATPFPPAAAEAGPAPGVSLRIGLHTGPVVAAVVAAAGPRYTLLGETAAVAAAMERGGAAGRIQCSAAFAGAVAAQAQDIVVRPRCAAVCRGAL